MGRIGVLSKPCPQRTRAGPAGPGRQKSQESLHYLYSTQRSLSHGEAHALINKKKLIFNFY